MKKEKKPEAKRTAEKPAGEQGSPPARRQGQKWDERIKTAAVCDLMVESNLSAVARRYGVPESTLRCWRDAARKQGGDDFVRARTDALRSMQYQAAQGALAAVGTLRRQLDEDRRNREICRRARRELEELSGIELVGENGIRAVEPDTEARGVLLRVIDDHKTMGETAVGSTLRILTAVQDRTAAVLQQESGEEDGFEIVMRGAAQEEGE